MKSNVRWCDPLRQKMKAWGLSKDELSSIVSTADRAIARGTSTSPVVVQISSGDSIVYGVLYIEECGNEIHVIDGNIDRCPIEE